MRGFSFSAILLEEHAIARLAPYAKAGIQEAIEEMPEIRKFLKPLVKRPKSTRLRRIDGDCRDRSLSTVYDQRLVELVDSNENWGRGKVSEEEDSPDKDFPGKDSLEEDSLAEDFPEEDSPEEDSPGADSPEEDSPETDSPEEDSPEADFLEEDGPEEDSSEEDSREENYLSD